MLVDEGGKACIELFGRREHVLEPVLVAAARRVLSKGLRLYFEEHHIERTPHFLGDSHTLIGQALGDVPHERTVDIVFEMRILHPCGDRQGVPDTLLLHNTEYLIHLFVMCLRLESLFSTSQTRVAA